jgi:hypothetical protein
MRPKTQFRWYARFGLALIGLGFLSVSLGHLLRGHMFYQTYSGEAAFVPIGLFVGALAIYFALFGKDEKRLRETPKKRKTR